MEFGSMEKGRHEQHCRGPLRLAGTGGGISTTQNGLVSGMEELVKSSNGTGSPLEELSRKAMEDATKWRHEQPDRRGPLRLRP